MGDAGVLHRPAAALDLLVPFFKNIAYPLGVFGFVVLSYLVIVGTSNAVNLTDVLDGLAIMPTMIGAALGVFAYVVGRADFARYLLFPYIPGAGELVIICAAIAGAGSHFSGSTPTPLRSSWVTSGRLALGGALGTIAVITREIVLFIMGGVFVVETISVMLQVTYFKSSGGRRIFRMAPLHHHFELSGWKDAGRRAVWIITMMLVLVGLSTLENSMRTLRIDERPRSCCSR